MLSSLSISQAQAVTFTQTGTFSADNQIYQYAFTIPTAQTIDFFTTSYAGGNNLNGTASQAGGFAPSLTLFSVTGTTVVDCGANGVTCSGMAMGPTKVDPTTKLADDVNLIETLKAGSYIVALTEAPNVAIGLTIGDGFLTSVVPTLFTDACGAGTFLESDIAPCAQRNGTFSLNVGTVPEPATFWLALPVLAFAMIGRKRLLARS